MELSFVKYTRICWFSITIHARKFFWCILCILPFPSYRCIIWMIVQCFIIIIAVVCRWDGICGFWSAYFSVCCIHAIGLHQSGILSFPAFRRLYARYKGLFFPHGTSWRNQKASDTADWGSSSSDVDFVKRMLVKVAMPFCRLVVNVLWSKVRVLMRFHMYTRLFDRFRPNCTISICTPSNGYG